MPINRPTWHRLSPRDAIPGLPCPRCATGKLKLALNGLRIAEPQYSVDYHGDPDWEPGNMVERWSATLKCDETPCGEIVELIGDTEDVEVEVETAPGHYAWGLEGMLRIQAAHPPPPLFRISETVPYKVKSQLKLAFRMYWTDISACVARLRTAVEAMLDDQKAPRERKTATGKMVRMNLQERISHFAQAADGAPHQDQLEGLRNIGNLGTHGGDDVTNEDLFDAIDVLEFVLAGIYDTKTIKTKAKTLATKKAGS